MCVWSRGRTAELHHFHFGAKSKTKSIIVINVSQCHCTCVILDFVKCYTGDSIDYHPRQYINTLNCPLVTSQAYRICAMGSEMQHDPEIGGCREHQWARRSLRLQFTQFMDLLPAFESGNFHDCTIRVGCDLQNSDASFRVSDAK